ncbi:MAG TPA: ATP-binding protein [Gammaproteobacteria bacterium]|nr:ATP-binding protein [Gammaproteobacteria bacterium]
MYLQRLLKISDLLKQKSFFLFGPRATGKTSLIREQLSANVLIINLLRSDMFLRLSADPSLLEEIIETRANAETIIVIDEVQKVPILLNEVHRLIEEKKIRFLLTGSSARKLRKNDVNLLAGRAWEARLFPLTRSEIPDFSLPRYLNFGGLPSVYLSENPREELIAYVDTYLKEEIQAEAVVRKIQSFAKFLQISALTSGKLLNFSSLSNDVGIPAATIREYYQVLEDTLIGFLLPAWTKTQKRKAISTAKFYFFDVGVMHQLAEIYTVEPNTDVYGQAFEHFIAMELSAYLSYNRKNLTLSFWAAPNEREVDFIIGDDIAIEIKSTKSVNAKHLKGIKALQEEGICKKYFLVSFDKIHRIHEGIEIIHWENFLDLLWQNKIV